MTSPTVLRASDASAVESLRTIDAAVRRATGHEAVPEAVWRAVVQAPVDCVLAVDVDAGVAALSMPSDSFTPAYRQLSVAAEPTVAPDRIAPVVDALLAVDGTATLTAWLPGTIAPIESALVGLGFCEDRRQHQMRVPLPRPDVATVPDGVQLRAFRPGLDDAAWLRVNNRAFANHPDQGGWVEEILTRRMAEPWFDPAGFLLAWRSREASGSADAGRIRAERPTDHDDLAGFCWTKVHEEPERLGEIFVIGVDPDAQGLGLGRALVLAGLDHLASVRECPNGVLYVAAANVVAVLLYESLGFVIHRTDTALVRERP
jgi:mycothiol synthase